MVIRNPAFFKGMVLEVPTKNKYLQETTVKYTQGPLILPDPAQVTPVRLLLGKMACR